MIEMYWESDPDHVRVRSIEVNFAIPVSLTFDQQRRLNDLLQEITQNPENTPKEGLHWLASSGAKPHWSKADAAFLGKAADDDAPENGEPSFDGTVLFFESAVRGFVTDAEREEAERERAAWAPAPTFFTCPRCGSHEWGALNPLAPVGRMERKCYGYKREREGLAAGLKACSFTWPEADDEKYGIPKSAGGEPKLEVETRRRVLERLSDDDFVAVIEMMNSERRKTIGNALVQGLGSASYEDWAKLEREKSIYEINYKNEVRTAMELRRRYGALPDELFSDFIERIAKNPASVPRPHTCIVTATTFDGTPLPRCNGCQDQALLDAARFKPGERVVLKSAFGRTPYRVAGLNLEYPLIERRYVLQHDPPVFEAYESELEAAGSLRA